MQGSRLMFNDPTSFSFLPPLTRVVGLDQETVVPLHVRAVPAALNLQSFDAPVSLRSLAASTPDLARDVFNQCYDLLAHCFPDRNSIARASTLYAELLDRRNTFDMEALIEGGKVIGAVHTRLIDSINPGLGRIGAIEHIYSSPDARSRGVGKSLLSHAETRMSDWGAQAVLCELNDPFAMTHEMLQLDEHTGITAHDRVLFWKRHGYEGIDAPYIQPRTEPDYTELFHMMVAVKRLSEDFQSPFPTVGYLGTLLAYHSAWSCSLRRNTLVIDLYKQIRHYCGSSVATIDLESARSCMRP